MADILSEMVEGAIPNPLTQEDKADQDTDAVVVPDFFERIRPLLCQPSGEPRRLVRAMPAVVVCIWLGFIVIMKFLAFPMMEGDPSADTPLMFMIFAGFSCAFTAPGLFIVQLYHAIAPGGPLEQLGAGEKRVSFQQLQALERAAWLPKMAGLCALLFTLMPLGAMFEMLLHTFGFIESSDPFIAALTKSGVAIFAFFFPVMGMNAVSASPLRRPGTTRLRWPFASHGMT